MTCLSMSNSVGSKSNKIEHCMTGDSHDALGNEFK